MQQQTRYKIKINQNQVVNEYVFFCGTPSLRPFLAIMYALNFLSTCLAWSPKWNVWGSVDAITVQIIKSLLFFDAHFFSKERKSRFLLCRKSDWNHSEYKKNSKSSRLLDFCCFWNRLLFWFHVQWVSPKKFPSFS